MCFNSNIVLAQRCKHTASPVDIPSLLILLKAEKDECCNTMKAITVCHEGGAHLTAHEGMSRPLGKENFPLGLRRQIKEVKELESLLESD